MTRPLQEIIREKRDGGSLSGADIAGFVAGLTDGRVTEGQAAAFAMAVYFRGLSRGERVALTLAMRDSGSVLAWDLAGPVLDKHSTGGVGDAVSLVLAPLVAACGGYVPKISGRGLGHTGGTLDKLESIPGYDSAPSLERLRTVVRDVGCAIVGQTDSLAPADKRLYAIRDVTGTVESLDLITTSILSKKLASGPDGLLLDVKTGSGAFLPGREDARALARSLVEVANGAGCRSVALITDMDAPLASCVGNAVEVTYAVDYLTGRLREPRFHAVVLALATEMLALGGLSGSPSEACGRLEAALVDGSAAERFSRMVAALGGPGDLVDDPARHLPRAPVVRAVEPDMTGAVTGIASRAVGLAVIDLGGGRTRPQDGIDHAVGFTRLARPGETVGHGRPLGLVHARDANGADKAAAALRAAYRIGGDAPDPAEAVIERIG